MLIALILAAGPTLQLEWQAPAECPDRSWLLGAIERVHGPLTAGSTDGFVARAEVRELRGRWEVEVETRLGTATGRRRLTVDSCTAAAKAAAVVISLALTDLPTQVPTDVAPPPAPASISSVSVEPFAPRIKVILAVSATVRSGPLPAPTPSGALTAGLWRDKLQLELTLFTPASATIPAGRGRAELSLPVSGELAGSWAFFEGPVELDVLLAVAAGWARGQSLDVVTPRAGDTAWLAIEPGAAVRFSLGQGFWARVEGRAGASLLRPRFQLDVGDGPSDLFQAQLFSGRAGFGIEAIF